MRKSSINLSALVASVIALGLGVVGCGGGSTPVARVESQQVSKALLDYWTRIQAVTDYESEPTHPVPAGVIPDPPKFAACARHLKVERTPFAPDYSRQPLSVLKQTCRKNYATLRTHIQNVLITFAWYLSEAKRLGVKVTDAEVAREYTRFSRERFPGPNDLRRYLKYTGERYSDELLRMKMDLISQRIDERITAQMSRLPQSQRQKAFLSWANDFPVRWAARTSCSKGFVTQNCREYKGTVAPEARL